MNAETVLALVTASAQVIERVLAAIRAGQAPRFEDGRALTAEDVLAVTGQLRGKADTLEAEALASLASRGAAPEGDRTGDEPI